MTKHSPQDSNRVVATFSNLFAMLPNLEDNLDHLFDQQVSIVVHFHGNSDFQQQVKREMRNRQYDVEKDHCEDDTPDDFVMDRRL